MFFMVSKSKTEMQNELVQKLYKEANFEHLLAESSDLVEKRERCRSTLQLLHTAQTILNEIRDYSIH